MVISGKSQYLMNTVQFRGVCPVLQNLDILGGGAGVAVLLLYIFQVQFD